MLVKYRQNFWIMSKWAFICTRCHIYEHLFTYYDKPKTRNFRCKKNYVKVVNKENNNLSLFSKDKISDSQNVDKGDTSYLWQIDR